MKICPVCKRDIKENGNGDYKCKCGYTELTANAIEKNPIRYIPMNFIDALNSALSKGTKLRITKGFNTTNPHDFYFLEPNEILYKLSNSSKEDIRILINSMWEVEGFTL